MRERRAHIGDVGVILGWRPHDLSGLAELLLDVSDGYATLPGDWRCIRMIAEALGGQRVQIVEAEGSSYGCHGVVPVGDGQGGVATRFSVRARRRTGRIRYRIVDDSFSDGSEYVISPASSRRPLTMRQLIAMIASADSGSGWQGLTNGYRDAQVGCGVAPEQIVDITVSSSFYPELSDWFEMESAAWHARWRC